MGTDTFGCGSLDFRPLGTKIKFVGTTLTDAARESEANLFKQPEILTEPFWIIWNPSHHLPPTVRFSSRTAAEQAAENMARRFRTDVFYVMAVTGAAFAKETPVEFVAIKRGGK